MSLPDENKLADNDEIESIFPTVESALYTLQIYSVGLESTQIVDFNFSARTGLAKLQKQICLTCFNHIDKRNNKEKKRNKNIIELIEGRVKAKRN